MLWRCTAPGRGSRALLCLSRHCTPATMDQEPAQRLLHQGGPRASPNCSSSPAGSKSTATSYHHTLQIYCKEQMARLRELTPLISQDKAACRPTTATHLTYPPKCTTPTGKPGLQLQNFHFYCYLNYSRSLFQVSRFTHREDKSERRHPWLQHSHNLI